ncbi:low density lipoprotein receptor adapter protein 1-like isoform X1 [Bombyx mandarina]|uniref:Low density lipoprotein receptor adapter protein 1-like isoform X1 n=2 Tax=Bombyx mandarina TaxID=7092 RepID=A0A6J2KNG3_BOMMA|nr:low density lipoprotein receptor adapter protein 1-like isoform X1 [Bombyx mandarina]
MATLLRKMWKNHSKHKKLSEEWALADCEGEGWWREVRDPNSKMDVRYAGSAPVERAASAPATAIGVRTALQSAKTLKKKPQKVNVDINIKGIIVTDAETENNVLAVSIYSISYCSADVANSRVFAVVEGAKGNDENDSHIVHVFVCSQRKQARALALSLAHAFNDAYQLWQANQAGSMNSNAKRTAPWVRFQEESDEEIDEEDWRSPAPLVTFA